ncbi:MAG: CheY-like chemotaxis protein/DNA-binding XRE family transcriptional regulator [Rickettsiales bacterium]|jgi:CheY-like chemotaxis protein/DNA-binding XRE family transcriptional regulator
MDGISKTIGQEIYKNRKIRSITRGDLAKAIGVSQALIQQYESGSTKISIEILYKIYHILKFSIDSSFDNIKKYEDQNLHNKDNKYIGTNKLSFLRILMIDDSIVDQMIFSDILKEIAIKSELTSVQDGEEAMNIVKKDAFNHNIMFLDINLPKYSGIEILKLIKRNDYIRNVPIVIYTSSIMEEDMKKCYQIGCNGYLIKTLDNELLKKNLSVTLQYWINNIIY